MKSKPRKGAYRWEAYDQQIDWCQSHDAKIAAGPLLKFSQGALPDWLYLWSGDFDNLLVGDYRLCRNDGRALSWPRAALELRRPTGRARHSGIVRRATFPVGGAASSKSCDDSIPKRQP